MKELFVRLLASDNKHLTYPCLGKLELFETGTNGELIVGVFRELNVADDGFAAPVEVRKCQFIYSHGLTAF